MLELADRRDLEPGHAEKNLRETDTVAHVEGLLAFVLT